MKQTMCFTSRLKIYTATREQMEGVIAAEADPEMKKAYGEMLEGCLKEPEKWEWYAMWRIELNDGTPIGDLCFKGIDEKGLPEIGYGIEPEYQGRGYATEAVKAAVKWAFSQPLVKAVEAETDPDNTASKKVLLKCGFQLTGEIGEEGPRFVVSR